MFPLFQFLVGLMATVGAFQEKLFRELTPEKEMFCSQRSWMHLQALDPTAFEDWPLIPLGQLQDLLMAWKNHVYSAAESRRLLWSVSTPCIDWTNRPRDAPMTYLFVSNEKDWNWLLDVWRFRSFVVFISDCTNLRWSRDDSHLSTHLVIGKIEFPVENSVLEVDWPKRAIGRIPREPRFKFEYDFKTKRVKANGKLWRIRKRFPRRRPCVQCADQCRFWKDRNLVKVVGEFLVKRANSTILSAQNVKCFPDLFIGYSSRAMSDLMVNLERFQLEGIENQDIVPKAYHMWINLNRTYRHHVSATYHDEVIVKVGQKPLFGPYEERLKRYESYFLQGCVSLLVMVSITSRGHIFIFFFLISNMLIFEFIRTPKTFSRVVIPVNPKHTSECPLSSSVVNSFEGRGPGFDLLSHCAGGDQSCSQLKRHRMQNHLERVVGYCIDTPLDMIATLEKEGYFDAEISYRVKVLKTSTGSVCEEQVRRGSEFGVVGEHHVPESLKDYPVMEQMRSVIYPLTVSSSQFSNHFEKLLKRLVETSSPFKPMPRKFRPEEKRRTILPGVRLDVIETLESIYPSGMAAALMVTISEQVLWVLLWLLRKIQPLLSFKFLMHRLTFFVIAFLVSSWFLAALIKNHLTLIQKN